MSESEPPDGADDRDRRIAELEAKLAERPEGPPPRSAMDRAARWLPYFALSNLLVSAPAFLISIGVAYFTFVQAEATEKMQVASVWPRVTYTNLNASQGERSRITLTLSNKGVGPAIIGGLQVKYRGRAYTEPRALLAACCGAAGSKLGLGLSSVPGEVLRPGEEMMVTQLNARGTPPDVYARFNRERRDLKISICYCSVFGDCWVDEDSGGDPRPADRCPIDWVQYTAFPQAGRERR